MLHGSFLGKSVKTIVTSSGLYTSQKEGPFVQDGINVFRAVGISFLVEVCILKV